VARILVIEDEEAVRLVVTKLLTRQGHEVTTAENGDEGIAKVRAGNVDLVLTDIIMPNKEGLETITEIKRTVPGIPIIAMSGYWGKPYLEAARKLGARGVLCKPFTGKDLETTIKAALSNHPEDLEQSSSETGP